MKKDIERIELPEMQLAFTFNNDFDVAQELIKEYLEKIGFPDAKRYRSQINDRNEVSYLMYAKIPINEKELESEGMIIVITVPKQNYVKLTYTKEPNEVLTKDELEETKFFKDVEDFFIKNEYEHSLEYLNYLAETVGNKDIVYIPYED
ncbi:MAG: hypothetical protein KJ971_07285 [Firmicutes bacterium]|nr:hypothetical protein [Bacillota bacterium]